MSLTSIMYDTTFRNKKQSTNILFWRNWDAQFPGLVFSWFHEVGLLLMSSTCGKDFCVKDSGCDLQTKNTSAISAVSK